MALSGRTVVPSAVPPQAKDMPTSRALIGSSPVVSVSKPASSAFSSSSTSARREFSSGTVT